jgi:hypothetical protein
MCRRDCDGLGGFVTAERSQNFGFLLDGHEPVFHQLAFAAEQVFAYDPNTTLVKVRQLAEAFAKHAGSLSTTPAVRTIREPRVRESLPPRHPATVKEPHPRESDAGEVSA